MGFYYVELECLTCGRGLNVPTTREVPKPEHYDNVVTCPNCRGRSYKIISIHRPSVSDGDTVQSQPLPYRTEAHGIWKDTWAHILEGAKAYAVMDSGPQLLENWTHEAPEPTPPELLPMLVKMRVFW